MSWTLLTVNYTDAVWSGLKRYTQINNEDGTVSFQDVTLYSGKETSFFGALNANRMNEALNTLMSMVENGTDLYESFQNYFATQQQLFEVATQDTEDDYRAEMDLFESQQQALFTTWFQQVQDQLSGDVAGNLQNQITAHVENKNNPHGVTASQVGAAASVHSHDASQVSAGTLSGAVLANATAVSTLASKQVRNVYIATTTEGVTLSDGDILHVYE